MTAAPHFYAQARAETAALLNYDLACLSPDQSLRLDCAVALRLALDDLQGRIVRGESVDVARMVTASEALARLLPPAVLAAPPSVQHGDPREVMFKIDMEMRERGEVPPEGHFQHRINELEAENERLKAQLAGGLAPAPPDVPMLVESVPAPAAAKNVVSLPRPLPPAASAAPQSSAAYDYNREQGWKDYVEADGTIRPTPRGRGHYWGPV
jgi:hypothetical protein